VRWLKIHTEDQPDVRVTGDRLFNFSLHYCSLSNLSSAKHTNEIELEQHPQLYIDLGQSGLGSNACGPDVLPQYRLNPQPYHFSVLLSVQ